MMAKPNLSRNIAAMFVWQIGNYVIPLLTFPYLTRVLGVRAFGEYGLGFAVAVYLVLVTDYGFALSGPGDISRNREDQEAVSRIFWSVLAGKAVLLVACLIVLVLAALLFHPVRAIAPVLFAASGMAVANVVTVNWCLQGFERLGKTAVGMTVGRALTVPATLLLVHSPDDAWIAAAVQSGGALVAGAISIAMLRQLHVIQWRAPSVASVRRQLVDAWPLFASTVSSNLYTTTNTVVLGILRGPSVVSIYAAADRLRAAAQGVVSPISQAVYPRASRLMQESQEAGLAFTRRLLLLQGLFTLLIAVTLFVGADPIVTILAGADFTASADVLRWLAPAPFLVGIANVLGVQMMLPLGMKQQFSRSMMAAAVLNVILIGPLSWWGGAQGAAMAALIAEVVVVSMMTVALKRRGVTLLRGSERKPAADPAAL